MTVANEQISVGVQELIEKLRTQGVASGREEADRMLTDARNEAAEILANAKKEAEALVAQAKKDAEFTVKSGEEALHMAGRNAVLELKDFLQKDFVEQLQNSIAGEFQKEDLLEKIILEVASRSSLKGEKNVDIILPQKVIGVEDLRENPEEAKAGKLMQMALGHAKDKLLEGTCFEVGDKQQFGVCFRLRDKNVEVVLDEHSVSAMVLKHLQPRFKVLLEGVIN
ncbi:hypothetical protein [Spongorhabdus nitratireducens]